jgi:hypothetical protein
LKYKMLGIFESLRAHHDVPRTGAVGGGRLALGL